MTFAGDPQDLAGIFASLDERVRALERLASSPTGFNILQAKGDLITATGPGQAVRFAVGPAGSALLSDPTQPDGLRWGSASGSFCGSDPTDVQISCDGTAVASGTGTVAIGTHALAIDSDDIAIGDTAATVVGGNQIAIGGFAATGGPAATAVGSGAFAEAAQSLAIGLADARGVSSTAVGDSASTSDAGATAIGVQSQAGLRGTALGYRSNAFNHGVAVGESSSAFDSAVAIGLGSGANPNSTAVGPQAQAGHDSSSSFGLNAATTAQHQVQLGTGGDHIIQGVPPFAQPGANLLPSQLSFSLDEVGHQVLATWKEFGGTVYSWGLGPVMVGTQQTGATYTFALSDMGTVVEGNNAAAQTFTIPPNASVTFPVGAIIEVFQLGAGQITIAAGAGVTIVSDGAKIKTAGQYASIGLRQRSTDEWVLTGDLA